MIWVVMGLVVSGLLLLIACTYIYTAFLHRRKQEEGYQMVVDYQMRVIEKDNFRMIHVEMRNDHERVFKFEFVPMFAHQFSDEMLTAVAHAGKPRSTDVSDTKGA